MAVARSSSVDFDSLRARWCEDERSARATVLPRRTEIGGYIAAVVDNLDTATFVNRRELQVGTDLQYIRINGTLVGGLVGS